MNNNSMAIVILCSHLCKNKDIKPFQPKEWSKFAQKLIDNNLTPASIVNSSSEDLNAYFTPVEVNRIVNLISRSASISFEVQKYSQMGINIVTRADKNYPKSLKSNLGKDCPPLFYYAGNLDLCKQKFIGFVGSRDIGEQDIAFTQKLVDNANKNNYGIVSGGAKGVDSISTSRSLENGSIAIEYISDSLVKKIRNKKTIDFIRSNKLLILSSAIPTASFNVGMAMNRNKYIYSQSVGTIVVKSDFDKGGTWAGAKEALSKNITPVFCNNDSYIYNNKEYSYEGNQELIKKGAFPIDINWNFEIKELKLKPKIEPKIEPKIHKQMSLFD